MAHLFEKTKIKNLSMVNRLVRSATWEGLCDDQGRPTEKLNQFYKALSDGSVGLIISGYTYVRPEGKQLPGQMGIYSDDFEKNYLKLTECVHKANGKIAIQLVHAGGQASRQVSGFAPVGPSAVQAAQFPEKPEALSVEDVQKIVNAFIRAAVRAKQWGFDAVQLHGAHGYLINQFLSPLTNHRNDQYGGGIENRCRFLMDIYNGIRQETGDDYPVMIKLNISDNQEAGLEPEEALYAARLLDRSGIDAIEVSSGTMASGKKGPARERINKPEKEAYNLDLAKLVKNEAGCPVMVVGGFRSFEIVQNAVQDHGMDYVALCRPLIREPGLINRWQSGNRQAAECISCNQCFRPGLSGEGIYCVAEQKAKKHSKK
ncbi:MAG: NADH:flavin oxidoreductase [Desulfobacteraceae bacterium]|nr:NADH:flavin oxidoreductase [Desulfobacteraceae bacterium]